MTRQATPTDAATIENERQQVYEALRGLHAYGFWTIQGDMEPQEPVVKEVPHIWKFKAFEPHLYRAAEIVPHELADRRGIIMHNPGYDMTRPFTTNTLFAAYSIYRPGEIFEPHIHTPAASRLMLRGDQGGYTTVEGEKAYLERGDLVLTPNSTWHDHGNEGSEPMIWVDMLDIPLARAFNAGVFGFGYTENGVPRDRQTPSRAENYSSRYFGAGGVRPRFAEARLGNDNGSPQMHFRYAHIRPVLEDLKSDPGDPYEGIVLDYVNVMTGGPVHKTQGFAIQLLRPGEETLPHRLTPNSINICLEGEGTSLVGGVELNWEENDTFVIPSYAWHTHRNTGSRDAVIFSFTDKPALEKLGLYWEERKTKAGETLRLGNVLP